MKSFKELRIELLESGLKDTMARKVGGIPLSVVASHGKAVEREAALNREANAPPKKPFVVGPDTKKVEGGLLNFPSEKKVDLDKPRETSPSVTVSPTKLGTAPLAAPVKQSADAARTAPVQKPVRTPVTKQQPSSGVKRLSTATGKPSKNIPVVDTAVKPVSKGSKSSAPVPVIKKVSPKELTKPKIAAKVDKSVDVAQQTGVTARMGQSGRTQTFSNIARGASSTKSSSGMFQKAGTEYSGQKNLPKQGSVARDVELAKRGFKKF